MFTASATTTAALASLTTLVESVAGQAVPLLVGLITATFIYVLIRRAIKKGAAKITKI